MDATGRKTNTSSSSAQTRSCLPCPSLLVLLCALEVSDLLGVLLHCGLQGLQLTVQGVNLFDCLGHLGGPVSSQPITFLPKKGPANPADLNTSFKVDEDLSERSNVDVAAC